MISSKYSFYAPILSVPVPPSADDLAALLLGAGKSAIWLPKSSGQIFSDTAGTTSVTPGSGSPVARVNDYSGNGFNLLQATAANRPVATNGLTFDGTDDQMDVAFANSSADYTVVLGYKGTDTAGVFISDTSTNVAGLFDGSATSNFIGMSGSAFADDVAVSTRIALRDAINDGVAHRVDLRNVTFGNYPTLRFGNSGYGSPFQLSGEVTAVVVIDNTVLTAQQQSDALALAQAVINEANA